MAVAISQSVGLVFVLGLALVSGEPFPEPASLAWGALAGVSVLVAVVALYQVLAIGRMSVGSPLVAVVGAGLPAAVGLALGDRLSPGDLAGIACGLAAVVAVSWAGAGRAASPGAGDRRIVVTAIVAGCGLAGFFLAIDQSAQLGGATWWPLAAARSATVVGIILAVARLRPSVPPARLWWPLIAVGLGDVLGNAFFVLANAQGALSVAVVLSSLYPVTTILLARLVLRERLRPVQALGVALALVGVVLMAV